MSSKHVFLRSLVALLVITTVVAGPMAGSAAARHQCDDLDALIYDSVNVGDYGWEVNGCGESHVDEAISNLSANDADQVRADVYSAAVDEAADNENSLNNYNNDLNSTDPVLWMDVETRVSQEYLNGSTQSESVTAAQNVAADGYSQRARQLIREWNTTVSEVERLENITDSEANVSEGYFDLNATPVTSSGDTSDMTVIIKGFSTTPVILPNGETATTRTIVVEVQQSGANFYHELDVSPATGALLRVDQYSSSDGSIDDEWNITAINSSAPDGSGEDPVRLVDFAEYGDRWDRTHQQADDLEAEAGVFVNNTYSAYDSGQINASDVISRNTAMFELAADEHQNNNSMYRSTAALGMMGLDLPDLESTGTMTVEYRQSTYHGLLLADSAPGGEWSANTTYHTSQTGMTYLVTTDGELTTLDGQYTLVSMTNEDGAQIDSINHTTTHYTVSNTSQFLSRQEAMQIYRQEAENRKQAYIATVGNGTSEGSGQVDPELLIILTGLAVGGLLCLYLLARFSPQGQVARRMTK